MRDCNEIRRRCCTNVTRNAVATFVIRAPKRTDHGDGIADSARGPIEGI
jgi:hypothetical protein